MKIFLCTWPHGAGGGCDNISDGMKIFLGDAQGRDGKDLAAMRMYLGAPTKQTVEDDVASMAARTAQRPLRILLSYHYYKNEDLDALLKACFTGVELDVFADSGAFSAFTVGEAIDEVAYTEWVKRWSHWFSCAAGPDVIGDPKKTTDATERMMAEVTNVPILPTFHMGEDWSWLDYWQDKTSYMAFGGMVPYSKQRKLLDAWCEKAFGRLAPEMRVHGFGMTTWGLLTKYPWYSVDSSSWTAGFRYAQLQLFDAQRGRMVEVKMNDTHSLMTNARLLATYHMRPSGTRADSYNRDMLCGVCVESWQRAEEWLTNRHVYLAAAAHRGSGWLGDIAKGSKVYAERSKP